MQTITQLISGIQETESALHLKHASELDWQPKLSLPPGAETANLYDGAGNNGYAFIGKFPADYTVPLHWHSQPCNVFVLSGSMFIRRKQQPEIRLAAQSFICLPAKMEYEAFTPEACTFLVWGPGTFDVCFC